MPNGSIGLTSHFNDAIGFLWYLIMHCWSFYILEQRTAAFFKQEELQFSVKKSRTSGEMLVKLYTRSAMADVIFTAFYFGYIFTTVMNIYDIFHLMKNGKEKKRGAQ